MLTDSFFQQGVLHEVCEDYAIHGDGYAIISDGCSNGDGPSIDTDFGARILVKEAERHLDLLRNANDHELAMRVFLRSVWMSAQSGRSLCFPTLVPECLTATLAMAYFTKAYHTVIVGDGAYGGRRKDGSWLIKIFEPISGGDRNQPAPFYLKYIMSKGEADTYRKMFGGKYRIHEYNGNPFDATTKAQITEVELDQDPEKWYFETSYPVDEFDWVFVATDGVGSFYQMIKTETSKYNEPIDPIQVLEVLFHELAFRPGCLRLQRNWAFKRSLPKTFVRRGWHNGDDCSMGIIHGS